MNWQCSDLFTASSVLALPIEVKAQPAMPIAPLMPKLIKKLNSHFVRNILEKLMPQAVCRLLIPVQYENSIAYYLLLTEQTQNNLSLQLDDQLQQSFHYRQARLLGQLAIPQVISRNDGLELIHNFFSQRGIALGNIKDQFLLTDVLVGIQLEKLVR